MAGAAAAAAAAGTATQVVRAAQVKECVKLLKQSKKESSLLAACVELAGAPAGSDAVCCSVDSAVLCAYLADGSAVAPLVALFEPRQSHAVLEAVGRLLAQWLQQPGAVALFEAEGASKRSSPCHDVRRFIELLSGKFPPGVRLSATRSLGALARKLCGANTGAGAATLDGEDAAAAAQDAAAGVAKVLKACLSAAEPGAASEPVANRAALFELLATVARTTPAAQAQALALRPCQQVLSALAQGALAGVEAAALALVFELSAQPRVAGEIIADAAAAAAAAGALAKAVDAQAAGPADAQLLAAAQQALLLWTWLQQQRQEQLQLQETRAAFAAPSDQELAALLRAARVPDLRFNACAALAHLPGATVRRLAELGAVTVFAELIASPLPTAGAAEADAALEHALHVSLKSALASVAEEKQHAQHQLEQHEQQQQQQQQQQHRESPTVKALPSPEQLVALLDSPRPLAACRLVLELLCSANLPSTHSDLAGGLIAHGAVAGLTKLLARARPEAELSSGAAQHNELRALACLIAQQLLPWLASTANRSSGKAAGVDWAALLGRVTALLEERGGPGDASSVSRVDLVQPALRPQWIMNESDKVATPEEEEVAAEASEEAKVREAAAGEGDETLAAAVGARVEAGRWCWIPRPESGELAALEAWQAPAALPDNMSDVLVVSACSSPGGLKPRKAQVEPVKPPTAIALEMYPMVPWAEHVEQQLDLRALALGLIAAMIRVDVAIARAGHDVAATTAAAEAAAAAAAAAAASAAATAAKDAKDAKAKDSKAKDKKEDKKKAEDTKVPAVDPLAPIFSALLLGVSERRLLRVVLAALAEASAERADSVVSEALRILTAVCALPGGRDALVAHNEAEADARQPPEAAAAAAAARALEYGSDEEAQAVAEEMAAASTAAKRTSFLAQLEQPHDGAERVRAFALRRIVDALTPFLTDPETTQECLAASLAVLAALCSEPSSAGASGKEQHAPLSLSDLFCGTTLLAGLLPAVVAYTSFEESDEISSTAQRLAQHLVGRGTALALDGEWAPLLNIVSGAALPHLLQEAGQSAVAVAVQLPEPTGLPLLELLLQAGADADSRDARGATPLMRAVLCGRERCVKRLLASGKVNVDAIDLLGRSVVLCALVGHPAGAEATGSAEDAPPSPSVVRQSLSALRCVAGSASCSVAARDDNEVNGDPRLLPLLVAAGADLNVAAVVMEEGPPFAYPVHMLARPLRVATIVDRRAVVLVSNPAKLAAAGPESPLALMAAAGASLDECDSNGQTALHCAVAFARGALVAELLGRRADPNVVDAHGDLALHIACARADYRAASALLKAGTGRAARSGVFVDWGFGRPARERNARRVLALLAKARAELEAPAAICELPLQPTDLMCTHNAQGWTPLHALLAGATCPPAVQPADMSRAAAAVFAGEASRLRCAVGGRAESALSARARSLQALVAEGLVDVAKCAAAAGGPGALPPLALLAQLPAKAGDEPYLSEIATVLTGPFAVNADTQDAVGLTAAHYAVLSGSPLMLRFCRDSAHLPGLALSPLLLVCMSLPGSEDADYSEVVDMLLAAGGRDCAGDGERLARLSLAPAFSGTALTVAASLGNAGLVRRLLAAPGGVAVDAIEGATGRSALLLAALRGAQDCVRLLLEVGGADPSALDARGESALHLAVRSGKPALVAFLLGSEASPGPAWALRVHRNQDGLSPLQLAEQLEMEQGGPSERDDVVMALLDASGSSAGRALVAPPGFSWEPLQFVQPHAGRPPREQGERESSAAPVDGTKAHVHPCFSAGVMHHEWVAAEQAWAQNVRDSEAAAVRIQAVARGTITRKSISTPAAETKAREEDEPPKPKKGSSDSKKKDAKPLSSKKKKEHA